MKNMKEIFIDIPNYKGIYKISNLGRIKSLERKMNPWNIGIRKEKILKSRIACGYKGVVLYKNNKNKSYKIHRLVMLSFHGNSDRPQVNHKDGNKLNNKLDNLEYCTVSENMQHAYNMGLVSKNRDSLKKPIIQYTIDGKFIAKYDSLVQAHKVTEINLSSISNCLNGRHKTAGDYKWKRA